MKKQKFRVAYATYNNNESKDALLCGLFREGFATVEAARTAIMDCIKCDAVEEIENGGEDAASPEELAKSWIWRDDRTQICEEHNGIESVYNITD